MPNALINENSPYLLQHAHQPVDWHPWGEAALEKAEREQKPIFLSIGYAACHWCHVMAHESFENGEIAAILNQYFVNIKVDREERPDLDGIYMQAVVAMTGQGGWPMSLFLTPDGKPFYGGTYFPPVRRYNMPAFGEILLNIARLWQEDRQAILEGAGKLTAHLQGLLRVDADANVSLTRETLEEAVMEIARRYDWKHGGWGRSPKFPQPMTIEFLLQRAIRGDKLALDMAVHALDSMAKGGMYDVVAGGFARYSTDERWLVPHFEKMLYDNAQLALVYLHGWLLTGNQAFRQVCEQTLDFVARELTHPEGGFFSSLDADSEEGEGRFYTWTIAEVENVLTSVDDIEFIKAAYGLTEQGNFDGSNLLQRVMTDEELTNRFHMSLEDVHERLKVCHQKLLVDRSRRPRPGTDDKVLASWNGLMQIAFAEAARHLQRSDYLETARKNARFLRKNLMVDGQLRRSWRSGRAVHQAYLEDYAALILGLLALYQTDFDMGWYRNALQLKEDMLQHFSTPSGDGFYDTRNDQKPLILRPRDLQDNATPSGNALAVSAILQFAALEGRPDWQDQAAGMIAPVLEQAVQFPTMFAKWLCAADFTLGPVAELVIIGEMEHPETRAMIEVVRKKYRPHLVVGHSGYPAASDVPAILKDRGLVAGKPTAYVCVWNTCKHPVHHAWQLEQQIESLD